MTKNASAMPTVRGDARAMALCVLQRIEAGEHAQAALDRALHADKMSGAASVAGGQGRVEQHPSQAVLGAQDRALCTELVYGYLRAEIRLGAVLDTLLPRRAKLPQDLQLVLGMSAYALLFLQRVPPYATLHWAVATVRKKFGSRMAGLCNAVLRSLQRLGDQPLRPEFYAKDKWGAAYYGLPAWIAQLWHTTYGKDVALLLMQRSAAQPWTALRLNGRHGAYADVQAALQALRSDTVCPVGKKGWAFAPGHCPSELAGCSMAQWHEAGAFSWQAGGSQQALQQCLDAVEDLAHAPWWDACAGQGGKTFFLLENACSVALCSDNSPSRLLLLQRTARRLQLPCPPVLRMSADRAALTQWSGHILLDVPCSGLGTLARRPEIRRRVPEDVQTLQELQKRIVQHAWQLLAPGFCLVYMTCTLNPDENGGQVRQLLALDHATQLCFEWQTDHAHPWMEGMYVAIVRKTLPVNFSARPTVNSASIAAQ